MNKEVVGGVIQGDSGFFGEASARESGDSFGGMAGAGITMWCGSFASNCRLVKPAKESNAKHCGHGR